MAGRQTLPPCEGQGKTDVVHEDGQILAPRYAHGDGGHGIFQHEVPADDPRHEFAHGGIGIGVGTAGNGEHRGELGIAQSGKAAGDGGEHE